MDGKDVLIDVLEENAGRIHWLVNQVPDACLYWQPDPTANSIAVTIWHTARVFDVFKTRLIDGEKAEQELWIQNGWSEKTGYNPQGTGTNGWGTIQGFTAEEVAAIPAFRREDLLGYFDEMAAAMKEFLADLPPDGLTAKAPGLGGQNIVYTWVKMPLLDMTRHLGEMFAIMAQYGRQHPDSGVEGV